MLPVTDSKPLLMMLPPVMLPVAVTELALIGPVGQGDVLVNIASGMAGRLDPKHANWGCVLGKSLENIAGNEIRKIEIVVGRF